MSQDLHRRGAGRPPAGPVCRAVVLLVLTAVVVLAPMGLPSGLPLLGAAPASAASPGPPGSDPAAMTGRWRWPLPPQPRVVRGFDPPAVRWAAGHRGVDLLGHPGAVVTAAGDGVVSFAGMVAGRPVVAVQHGQLRTTYEPVTASVRVGQRVAAGAALGRLRVLGGHCLPRACLHWGLRRGRDYLDPLMLVRRGPPRLLPVWSTGAGAGVGAVAPSTAPVADIAGADAARQAGRAPMATAGRPASSSNAPTGPAASTTLALVGAGAVAGGTLLVGARRRGS